MLSTDLTFLTCTYNYGSNYPTFLWKVNCRHPSKDDITMWSSKLRRFYMREDNNPNPMATMSISHAISANDVVFSVCFTPPL